MVDFFRPPPRRPPNDLAFYALLVMLACVLLAAVRLAA